MKSVHGTLAGSNQGTGSSAQWKVQMYYSWLPMRCKFCSTKCVSLHGPLTSRDVPKVNKDSFFRHLGYCSYNICEGSTDFATASANAWHLNHGSGFRASSKQQRIRVQNIHHDIALWFTQSRGCGFWECLGQFSSAICTSRKRNVHKGHLQLWKAPRVKILKQTKHSR